MKFYKIDESLYKPVKIIIQERGYGQEQAEKVYKKNKEKKMKMWQVRYFDSYGVKVDVLILARTKQSLLNKFRREFGYYTIIDIKEIGQ